MIADIIDLPLSNKTIPNNWRLLTVDEIKSKGKKSIISGPFGSNISSKYFVNQGVPVIRGNNLSLNIGIRFNDNGFVYITDEKANELNTWATKDDLIFTAVGTIGQVGILTGKEKYDKYIISNKQLRVTVDAEIVLPIFAYYWFASESMVDQIEQRNTGSSVPLINLSVLKSLSIPIPPIEEQKAIASVLSSLDDKIDLLHRQNTTLERMAETLFRQWFVEEAQEDWEEVNITKLFDVRDGTHDSPKQKKIGKPLITSKHINGNRLDFESAYLISDEDFEKINQRSKVDKNDILISMIGTIGLIYLEQSDEVNYAIKNVGLFKTSQNPNWMAYTYFWLKSHLGRQFLDEHISGSTQEYVSLGSFRSITFKKPPIEKLEEFNKVANGYLHKIKNNSAQIQTLEKLRDNLLPKLMNGEVKVAV